MSEIETVEATVTEAPKTQAVIVIMVRTGNGLWWSASTTNEMHVVSECAAWKSQGYDVKLLKAEFPL